MAARRALITGIAGQDGSLLAELLLAEGYEVFGVVRRATSEQFENLEVVRDRVELVQADLLDELSNQYLLGYEPTNTKHDDVWRKIKVDVDGHHDVRARQGYRATTAK